MAQETKQVGVERLLAVERDLRTLHRRATADVERREAEGINAVYERGKAYGYSVAASSVAALLDEAPDA